MRPSNLTEHPSSEKVFSASTDRFAQALVKWFGLHRRLWSGTATELIAAVGTEAWSQSPHALYAYVESHRQVLRSLGVDVLPHRGFPRMVSLRSCQEKQQTKETHSDKPEIERSFDPPGNPGPPAAQETALGDSGKVSPAASKTLPVLPVAGPGRAESLANSPHQHGHTPERHVFEDTAQALFSIVEMQGRIREQSLDLKSTIELVAELVADRLREITQCKGVVVAVLHLDNLIYVVRKGIAVSMAGLQSQTKLLRSCLTTGQVLSFPEAQKNGLVGAACYQEGIKSLIVVPIFRNRKVAGAMELLFEEMRSLSDGDIMTLELVADVVSEAVEGADRAESKRAEELEGMGKPKALESPQLGDSLNEEADRIGPLRSLEGIGSEKSLRKPAIRESSTPSLGWPLRPVRGGSRG
jgi:GAF domain-containing protein